MVYGMQYWRRPRIPGAKCFEAGATRYVPARPPTGDFKHMVKLEASRHEAFQSEKTYGCKKEMEALKQCWAGSGADLTDKNYKCEELEHVYMDCMEGSNNLDPLAGFEKSNEFHGENLKQFVFRLSQPLRAKSKNPEISCLHDNPKPFSCYTGWRNPRKKLWTGGKRISYRKRAKADWTRRMRWAGEGMGRADRNHDMAGSR